MIYHLCLGANLGKPEDQIDKAIQSIAALDDVVVLRSSSLIVSKPYGKLDQPDFYNQVLEINSSLSPQQLLAKLLKIEHSMGRIRHEIWGARLIDIDILLAEDAIVNINEQNALPELPNVIIPHPDFHNRLFALQLLNELIPGVIHPVMHKTINELYFLLRNSGGKP
jgi:2-amino-4-hydroxy-6-hydroxymethyldihydropteridine diphosphokinase